MSSPARRWLPVVLWVVVIYTTIGFVRQLREWFIERWDPTLITWLVAASLVTGGVVGAVFLRRRFAELRRGAGLSILVVTTLFVAWSFSLRRSPEEAVHFIEYGILAILIFSALRPSTPNGWVYVAGALIGSLVGTVDEVIQWCSPSRTWDWRDIVLNAGAGALVQIGLWRTIPLLNPSGLARAARLTLRLAVAQLLLFTLCLANTPRMVESYAPLLPRAGHLTSSRNPMAEYGQLHTAPGIGMFRSRLSLEELANEDRTRAAEVAAVIDSTRRCYGYFLDTWSVAEDPFTYEARVHLFARDRNFAKARERGFSGPLARRDMSVAWSENRLLEDVFPHTLANSAATWHKHQRRRAEKLRIPGFDFTSNAGSHLITIASEGALRTVLLLVAGLLVVVDLALGRYHRRRS